MKTYECFHHHSRIINDSVYHGGDSPPHVEVGDKIHDAEGHDEYVIVRRLVSHYEPATVVGGYTTRIDYFCATPAEYEVLRPDDGPQTYEEPVQAWSSEELDELRELLRASREREVDLIADRDQQLEIVKSLGTRLSTANGLLIRCRDMLSEFRDLLHEGNLAG